MNSENRKKRTPQNNPPRLDLTASNIIPPVEMAPLQASDDDLNQWASERIAIYSSLDTAMTRNIIEAIGALSELKRRVEEEAQETSQQIIVQRDRLKQQVEALRLEQIRLEDGMKESRRAYEDEQARRIALEHSSAAWLEQARLERDELQRETKLARIQLEEARLELQAFYRDRAEMIEEGGGFAAWLEKQPKKPEPIYRPVELPPIRVKPDEEPLPIFIMPPEEGEPAIPFTNIQSFGDAPTPRLPGGSPVATATPASKPSPSTSVAPITTIEEVLDDDDEKARADLEAIFNSPIELPNAKAVAPKPPVKQVEEKPATPTLSETPVEKTRDRVRRARTEQRVQHILGKRRPQAAQTTVAADAGTNSAKPPLVEAQPNSGPEVVPVEAELIEASAVGAVSTGTGRGKGSKRRNASPEDKAAMQELGQKLGLDPMTPPPEEAIRFAPGYTPPPAVPLSRRILEMKASNETVATEPPPARSVPLLEPFSEDFSTEDEFGPMTLEELLEAGEQEVASINENPTPPEDPSPFIGNLGPDNALHFMTEPVTPPGQIRADKFNPIAPPIASMPPPRAANGTAPRKQTGPLFPGFPLPPPPSPPSTGSEVGETNFTKLTVSNLQGRYSPLVMEKVVRGLSGVVHVIVTDFSKGVLVMDVRHQISLELAEKLLSMPDLRLKLIEQGPASLEFSQETT